MRKDDSKEGKSKEQSQHSAFGSSIHLKLLEWFAGNMLTKHFNTNSHANWLHRAEMYRIAWHTLIEYNGMSFWFVISTIFRQMICRKCMICTWNQASDYVFVFVCIFEYNSIILISLIWLKIDSQSVCTSWWQLWGPRMCGDDWLLLRFSIWMKQKNQSNGCVCVCC